MSTLAPQAGLRRLAGALLDVLLPPRCLACGETVAQAGTLCARCWAGVTFLGSPCCACCGLPFDFDAGEASLCGACTRDHPAYDRARAVMRYDEGSRRLVLAFKHGDRLHLAPAFGAWLRRAWSVNRMTRTCHPKLLHCVIHKSCMALAEANIPATILI